MRFRDWLQQQMLSDLRFGPSALAAAWAPGEADRLAAWDLYIEFTTRISTQRLPEAQGDEVAALASLHRLFDLTRQALKAHGRCACVAKIALAVLNQQVRPVTAKWHARSLQGDLGGSEARAEFRAELVQLQDKLGSFVKALADLAEVDDFSSLED